MTDNVRGGEELWLWRKTKPYASSREAEAMLPMDRISQFQSAQVELRQKLTDGWEIVRPAKIMEVGVIARGHTARTEVIVTAYIRRIQTEEPA